MSPIQKQNCYIQNLKQNMKYNLQLLAKYDDDDDDTLLTDSTDIIKQVY